MKINRKILLSGLVLLVCGLCSVSAYAGPPFRTDDPDLLPYLGGEAYIFSSGTFDNSGVGGVGPAIEFNYEFLRKGFFHLVLPLAFNDPRHSTSYFGAGDIELGFKYQFTGQKGWFPAIATFPLMEVPTGRVSEGLGNGKPQYFIPIWLEENIGKWTVYGGGGYWFNGGPGNKNFDFTGILVQYNFTDDFFLGAELFHHTPSALNGINRTGIHLGGGIPLYKNLQLLFSGDLGNGITSYKHYSYYLGLHYVFG
ncbi:MAG TPA: hypothetical protein VKA08_02070 [Balneolales bacterium]|jgi:hypothetical protein|nr:hypothetical protein [Balneolales bacterium]